MFAKKSRYVALAAAAALSATGLVAIAPAQAADKEVIIWTDEKRGPAVEKLFAAIPPNITGYTFKIVSYASLDALDKAWADATAANGPDLVISNSAYALQGATDGKLTALSLPAATKAQFSAAALNTLSFEGLLYGVPLDMDTTAMYYNKTLVKTPPKTFGDMVTLFKSLKTSKKLTGGFCAWDGVWGSQPMLTALGGGAWGYKPDGSPNKSKVLLNSAALKANITKYLIDAKTKKSNNFFKWDGCGADFKAGKILFANSGGWQLDDATFKAAVASGKFGVMGVPGLVAGKTGSPWVGYQGIYVTTFAGTHGVAAGAKKMAISYFASPTVQAKLSVLGGRPAANKAAAAKITDPTIKGFAKAGANGLPQVDSLLNAGTTSWYAVLGSLYTDIFVKGKAVGSSLDKAAAVVKANFAKVKL